LKKASVRFSELKTDSLEPAKTLMLEKASPKFKKKSTAVLKVRFIQHTASSAALRFYFVGRFWDWTPNY
jgi:hypothetical protein